MNPVALSDEIEARYQAYLRTTFYFRDPDLRSSFQKRLASGPLRRGPYLEGTPVFVTGRTTSAVFQEILDRRADPGFLAALRGERLLYSHQEEALRSASAGENVVVATGTGSGKTESFLYPILLELYRQYLGKQLSDGVRAIVLYPMNALANDQRGRLGEIASKLERSGSAFRFSYGQYTGETPENEADSYRSGRSYQENRLPGELVFRQEMRDNPPNILLTNYSMLEYLLLRPKDSDLFDGGRGRSWRFIVLDEAHQYRGAKGIEMAMLLRRLKDRLAEGGHEGSLQCLATSATLMDNEKDCGAVAQFAADLFGEPFREGGIILGRTKSLPRRPEHCLEPEMYKELLGWLNSGRVTVGTLQAAGQRLGVTVSGDESGDESARCLGRLLARDARAHDLRQRIATPTPVEDLAQHCFGARTPDTMEALKSLVELLAGAEPALLAPRYHLFLRSLEGAFLSLGDKPSVSLDRTDPGGGLVFETALCRECGQHYLVGKIEGDHLVEAVRDTGDVEYGGLSFFRPVDLAETPEQPNDLYVLCGKCGEIRPLTQALRCTHQRAIRVVKEKRSAAQEDQLSTCGTCGYRGRDPVREVVHGTDGPHAVIATTIHSNLPENSRKLLAFADGRQSAAFFAWYLDESYREIQSRNLLLQVVGKLQKQSGESPSLPDLAFMLEKEIRRLLPQTASRLESSREAWKAVYREFLTDERRISLEGVGLLRWTLCLPDDCDAHRIFLCDPWNLSEAEAHDLTVLLLDTFRIDRAMELKTDESVGLAWADLDLEVPQMSFRIGDPQSKYAHSWDGGQTRRADFLLRLLRTRGLDGRQAAELTPKTLREFWHKIVERDQRTEAGDRILLSADNGRRANPLWWRAEAVSADDSLYQCVLCGRVQSLSVGGLCARHRCAGNVVRKRVAALESNHYRDLYEKPDLPLKLRVEEHTAQLEKNKAREFQRDFKEGRIGVLSCSTTFELGVDLGDLDTVFLRNVPPESFNYAQRVGRAGRRAGHTGFAVTYCRRTPHDLSHFAEPERMLAGKVRPPVLSIANEKIAGRHLTATALSSFFRSHGERFESVRKLLGDMAAPSGVAAFNDFVLRHRQDLETAFRNILPPNLCERLLTTGDWMDRIADRFHQAEAESGEDYRRLAALERQASEGREYRTAEWARRRIQTIETEETLSFLSRKAVIPKYGFPVDVVDLDTQPVNREESAAVVLQRDLAIAIAEFAPTSKLVANKREWESYALKRVAEREWPRRNYRKCSKHNIFVQWDAGQNPQGLPCGCQPEVWTYVIPQFGFSTKIGPPKPPKSRTARPFTTRPYFVRSLEAPGEIAVPAHSPTLRLTEASPGIMVVLCEGKKGGGFWICSACGAGFRERPGSPHTTSYGQPCRGVLSRVSLGHEFTTDVVRLQFLIPGPQDEDPRWFAIALAAALVEGAAEVLETAPSDISSTVAQSMDAAKPAIVLYDNVPGGAGLVARLPHIPTLLDVLRSARKRIDGRCGCGEGTSCYGCLRSYRNQFAHHRLKRGPVLSYLDEIIRRISDSR